MSYKVTTAHVANIWDFPVIFLLQIATLIPLGTDNIFCKTNPLKYIKTKSMAYFGSVSYTHEMNVNSAVTECMFIRSSLLNNVHSNHICAYEICA